MAPASSRSPIHLTEELTRKVAHLARLEVTDSEVRIFTTQLEAILGYVKQLESVDVTGVEPLTGLEGETAMREDEARPSPVSKDGTPKVLQSAPEVLSGGFKVPPIL